MLRYSALIIPFALSGCAALELASRADDLQQVVDLGTEFQDAINASSGGSGTDGSGTDGGGTGGGTTVPEGIELVTDEELVGRTGSVEYSGYAVLYVPRANANIALNAISRTTADFDSNTVEATFKDWIGVRVDDNYDPIGTTGSAANASGEVEFSNGEFVLDGGDATFVGEVNGELQYRGDSYTVAGDVEGAIGTEDGGAENIAAIADDDAIITVNGNQIDDADFGFQGEIVE